MRVHRESVSVAVVNNEVDLALESDEDAARLHQVRDRILLGVFPEALNELDGSLDTVEGVAC